MVRRYKRVRRGLEDRPRPGEVWGAWGAVLKEDASDKDLKKFVEDCILLSTEGKFISLEEGGYKGSCLDFIFENRGKLTKTEVSTVVSLLGSDPRLRFDYSAPLCSSNGDHISCVGKIIDYTTEVLAKTDSKEIRDAFTSFIMNQNVDLAAPLCKIPDGSSIACIQKVLDDAASVVALEQKMATGQSLIPSFKSECRTLEDNEKTTCIDKVLDNLIRYGSDIKDAKYKHKDASYYQSLIRAMAANEHMSGLYDLLQEGMFYDTGAEMFVTGYDKLIRRIGDRGVQRDFLTSTVDTLIDAGAFNYSRLARDNKACNHPFLGKESTCLDTVLALMYDRMPESPTSKAFPKSSARRFAALEKIANAVAHSVKFEEHNCIAIPPPGKEWKDETLNCISAVLAIPSDKLSVTVFDPTRLTSIVSKSCRYIKPDGEAIEIPCFEAVFRSVTSRAEKNPAYDYGPIARSIVMTDGVDLAKPCNNKGFTSVTSCLDLLLDIDTKNEVIDHYLRGAIKTDFGRIPCSIPKGWDTYNAFDTMVTGAALPMKNPGEFQRKVVGDSTSAVGVSCLDKIITMTMQQSVGGFSDVYKAARGRAPPNFATLGLAILTGDGIRGDPQCRYIYPDANENPVEATVPCYQKYLESFMPMDRALGVVPGYLNEHIHEMIHDLDLSKPCVLYEGGAPTIAPCMAAMFIKYGVNRALYIDDRGRTLARDETGNSDDFRCSLIGSKHFGKIIESVKNLAENPKYKPKIGGFRDKMCNNLMCKSKPGDEDGIDRRSKGKLGKLMYCHCDEHITPDGKFTPDGATCFEDACYHTVAKFGPDYPWNDFKRFYAAGDQIPPLIRYANQSAPNDAYKFGDISGVYEVTPKISPYDFHVRRYITEFVKIIDKIYGIATENPVRFEINSVNVKKLMEMTGKNTLEEAVMVAKNLSAEQMNEIDSGKTKSESKPSISIYFKKGGARIDIPANVVKTATKITSYVIEDPREVYTKRPEWNPDYIEAGFKDAINAITMISEAYVESDDRNIYIEIAYKDRNGNSIQDFQFHEEMPPKEEIVLSKAQQRELKDAKKIVLPDGRVVKVRYNLFARPLVNSYRLSKLINLPFIPLDVKTQIEEASRIAAGMPETPMKVVITTDPRDIMRASTCQSWGSCIKLEDGGRENTQAVAVYIKSGSYIAFITDDINNPMWKGRTLIHRSTNPKFLALQDRWTRDCGVEYIYGMPEFRRLLLDTIRVVMASNGYNRPDDRDKVALPKYLFSDYYEHPMKYLTGTPEYAEVCKIYQSGEGAGAHINMEELVAWFSDAKYEPMWKKVAEERAHINYEEFKNRSIRNMAEPGLNPAEIEKRAMADISRQIITAYPRDFFTNEDYQKHQPPKTCDPKDRMWSAYLKSIVSGQVREMADKIEWISPSMWYDVDHAHGAPDKRGVECGPSQEFRAITDDEIEEIKKYRGENFVKPLGKYVRPYPTKPIRL